SPRVGLLPTLGLSVCCENCGSNYVYDAEFMTRTEYDYDRAVWAAGFRGEPEPGRTRLLKVFLCRIYRICSITINQSNHSPPTRYLNRLSATQTSYYVTITHL